MKKQSKSENISVITTLPRPAEKAETWWGGENKCVYAIAVFFVTLLVLSGCVRRIVTGPDYSSHIDSFMGTYVGKSYFIYYTLGSLPVYDTIDSAAVTFIRYSGDSFYKKFTNIGFNYNSSNYYEYFTTDYGIATCSMYPQLDSIFCTSDGQDPRVGTGYTDTFYGKKVR